MNSARLFEKKSKFPQAEMLEKPILRIYPLANDYIAAALGTAPHEQFPNLKKYTYSLFKTQPFCRTTITHADGVDYQARVLPNGFYFHENGCYPTAAQQKLKQGAPIELRNLFYKINLLIRSPLNTALAAILYDAEKNSQLLCVSKDGKKIYDFDLETKIQKVGFEVSNYNENICSISTFYHYKKSYLAVALNTGEVKLIRYKHKETKTIQLENPEAELGELELLASQKGFLIGYSAKKNVLRIWDFNHDFNFKDYFCPKLFKLNISPRGEYVTALEHQESSAKVFIYQLSPFKLHTLTFKVPVSDFAIGQHNIVTQVANNKFEQSGKLDEFLATFPSISISLEEPISLCYQIKARFFTKLKNKISEKIDQVKNSPHMIC